MPKTVNLTKPPTYNQARALLDAIVAERGADYIYPGDDGCHYVVDGQPDCGVGLALHKHGVPLDNFIEGPCASTEMRRLWPGHRIDPGAAHLLDTFQHDQDRGYSWGDARERALAAPLDNRGVA